MFTNQWSVYLAARMQGASSGSSTTGEFNVNVASGLCKNLSGESVTQTLGSSYLLSQVSTMYGTGTTPAARTDYNMESQITTGISSSKGSLSKLVNGSGDFVLSFVDTVRNASENSITISEIGLNVSSRKTSSTSENLLIYHDVLTTPITIPAGESKNVEFTLRFPMPV